MDRTPMLLQRHLILFLSLLLMTAASCVSVNIKSEPPTKSKDYQYVAPPRPFERMKNEQTDLVWQNSANGNTIAVLSECSETQDPSLIALEGETIQALNNYQFLKTAELRFADRAARRSQVEGSVDGIQVKMDVLTFKKNSCAYTLTYVGPAKGFDQDQSVFDRFLSGFQVP